MCASPRPLGDFTKPCRKKDAKTSTSKLLRVLVTQTRNLGLWMPWCEPVINLPRNYHKPVSVFFVYPECHGNKSAKMIGGSVIALFLANFQQAMQNRSSS
mmetsp:Transcript_31775/g.71248  ORF Transcript_31775/g.71248 Transcript_31775/m.71248 type:complete len:100 (-) Transcript_31775:650-949(-)